jgi:hypothetical protein
MQMWPGFLNKMGINTRIVFSFLCLLALSACGSSDGLPNVTVSLTSSVPQAVVDDVITLTWASTNATNCTASGAWSGSKAASGSEAVTVTSAGAASYSLSCRGEGEAYSAAVSVDVLPTLILLPTDITALATNEDVAVSASIEGFTSNREPLTAVTFSIFEAPELGSLTVSESGLTYVPLVDANGADTFVITASAEGVEAQMPFEIMIAAVDDPPTLALSARGLALSGDLDLLFADPNFEFTIAVEDIDTPVDSLTYAARINGAASSVEVTSGVAQVSPYADFAAGRSELSLTVSDGTSEVTQAIAFWGAETLSQNPGRARVTQLFGNVRSNSRQIDHYVVLDNLTDADIKAAVWEALAYFYDNFFVQDDSRRQALVNAFFNVIVVDFPEGLNDPFTVQTGCNLSAPDAYCMSDIVPQALEFLDDLALYDDLTDVRVAADIFSLVTSVPGEGVAVGRYNVQSMTSPADTDDEAGPNQLLLGLKHEMGHSFGWLGDHSTEAFLAVNGEGDSANDFTPQLPTVDFLYADITLSDSVSEVKWQHQYRDSNSIPGWNTVDDTSNSALGYWQGCYFHDEHCFRSSHNSVMNGNFTSELERSAWLTTRARSDAVDYDAVGTEAQFLRALQLQGSQDVTLYLPSSGDDHLVLDHRVMLPNELFAIDWFLDGELITDFTAAGIDYRVGGPSDTYVGRLSLPRQAAGTTTHIAYRIRDISESPAVTVIDELNVFSDVYLGRFSPEGGFYLCPELNTAWPGVSDTYCHATLEAYRSDGALVTEAQSVDELLDAHDDVTYFIERSGLGIHVMIDWTYF